MRLSTPDGISVDPTPEAAQPVAATGQTLTSLVAATLTVTPGAYAITSDVGYVVLGWATVATAANIIFVCPEQKTIIINVPIGTTALHYKCV